MHSRWPAGRADRKLGTNAPVDLGAQYSSWIFGHRLRQAGLLGSAGRVASYVGDAPIESFWSTMRRELLNRNTWDSRGGLSRVIFEWIEGLYNPSRRQTALTGQCARSVSPRTFESLHTRAQIAA